MEAKSDSRKSTAYGEILRNLCVAAEDPYLASAAYVFRLIPVNRSGAIRPPVPDDFRL